MEKVVVTGGSGYIGSHIVKLLAESNIATHSIDKLVPSWSRSMNVKSYCVDITDIKELNKVFNKIGNIDCVIHCAGELGIERSYKQEPLFYHQNIYGTDTIINAVIQHNIRNVIFASSAAVYAPSYEPQTIYNKIDKDASPYTFTKIECERRIKDMLSRYDINYIIFRYFNVIGCDVNDSSMFELYMKQNNIIPNILRSLKYKELFIVNGCNYNTIDGTCVRDYINVKDLSMLHLCACKEMFSNNWRPQYNGVYNAGSGTAYSVLDIIEIIENLSGDCIQKKFNEMRAGDSPYLCANIEYTTQCFNWKPENSIHETIRELKNVYLSSRF